MTWPNNRHRSGNRAAGFTLIEVIVVLVRLGLGLALLTTRGPLRSTALDLRAATGEITQALRLARARAIATYRPVIVALDPAGNAFRVGSGPAVAHPLLQGEVDQFRTPRSSAPSWRVWSGGGGRTARRRPRGGGRRRGFCGRFLT